jgi:branched-chain amino acid transport system substrate-binding protein
MIHKKPSASLSRRRVLQTGTAAVAAGSLASSLGFPALAADRPFKVGYVTPQTGPLAPFGEADSFVISTAGSQLANGVKIGGKNIPVEIVIKDSQSNPNRAAEVAADLILKDKVDLMLVASTPETTNPVSDQCELNEVPCVSTVAPWQPWFFARGGDPAKGFNYTYHYFWGLEDVIAVFTNMWSQVETDKVVGGLFPNDGDGNAWGDKEHGFPGPLDKLGYKLVDPGRYQNLNDNFTAQINAFKAAKADIVTGVVIPPDIKTFWTQAIQQGFKPKVLSVGKALLFPVVVESLGDNGTNISTEVWWTPSHPFKSSLTGQSTKELAAAFESATKKQWTQPIGFAHSLIEVAADVLKRSAGPGDRKSVLEAVTKTKLDTIVGPIAWGGPGPFKNVSKTPLVGGQWRKGAKFKYDLVVVDNKTAPSIPVGGKMEPIA